MNSTPARSTSFLISISEGFIGASSAASSQLLILTYLRCSTLF
ncbi:hypothetical protein RSAG8_08635, partial [Rhizoctonia solani AG-8 WAC10335]